MKEKWNQKVTGISYVLVNTQGICFHNTVLRAFITFSFRKYVESPSNQSKNGCYIFTEILVCCTYGVFFIDRAPDNMARCHIYMHLGLKACQSTCSYSFWSRKVWSTPNMHSGWVVTWFLFGYSARERKWPTFVDLIILMEGKNRFLYVLSFLLRKLYTIF